MEEIIAPIAKEVLKAELTEDKRLRFTNKSNNEIYIVTYQDSPNVVREIGRLREIAFRMAGGGTGKSLDLDEYDVMEHPYKQLIVWDPEAESSYHLLYGVLSTPKLFLIDRHGVIVGRNLDAGSLRQLLDSFSAERVRLLASMHARDEGELAA